MFCLYFLSVVLTIVLSGTIVLIARVVIKGADSQNPLCHVAIFNAVVIPKINAETS